MIAFVLAVTYGEIVSREIFCELRSTSAKTGVAPRVITQFADAINVRGVTITSSPCLIFKAYNASSKAVVPFETAIA